MSEKLSFIYVNIYIVMFGNVALWYLIFFYCIVRLIRYKAYIWQIAISEKYLFVLMDPGFLIKFQFIKHEHLKTAPNIDIGI